MNLPENFVRRMKELLGNEYEDFLASYDEPRHYGLRVNTSKISCEEFEKICPFEIKKIPWIPNGYYYNGEDQPAKHPYYHAGLYYLQEPSAMTPASRLPVEPGEAVLDLCAAPGGKATELGVKLAGSGVLVANDISNSRAKALLKNIELFGISNPFVVSENPSKLAGYFEGYFDKILLDAPCSGEGMFRKDPAVMKSYEQNGVDFYAKLQREIIIPAVRMLKPGGMMLYSTCTFSPEEDEQAVLYLLDNCPDMELVDMEDYEGFGRGIPGADINIKKCVRIWPHKMGGEGHFLALLRKKAPYEKEAGIKTVGVSYADNNSDSRMMTGTFEEGYNNIGNNIKKNTLKKYQKNNKNINKKNASSEASGIDNFFEFAKALDRDIDNDRLELQGERLFLMPEGMQGLKGLRFLRNGLFLGSCLKGRFEPSQALAMAIGRGEYKNTVSFPADDERVTRYLKGETITLNENETVSKGWNLICVDGFPLGWCKANGRTLKNKYHSGWRLM